MLDETEYNNPIYSEGDGCGRNMTCGIHYYTYLRSDFGSTEIPLPSDVNPEYKSFLPQTIHGGSQSAPSGPPVDIVSYFGIICENNQWYATKYPVGIEYRTNEEKTKIIGTAGEFNGKKSLIYRIVCNPPGPAQCACSDIRDLVKDGYRDSAPVIEGPGCIRSITCGLHTGTHIYFTFNETELPYPSDYAGNTDFLVIRSIAAIAWAAPPGPPIDIISYFGIICDNGVWHATKYPFGMLYYSSDYDLIAIGMNGELDGKKTKIGTFACSAPSQCNCPDFRGLANEDYHRDDKQNISIIENGCVTTVTCGFHYDTQLFFYFNESAVAPPADLRDGTLAALRTTTNTSENAPPVNIMSYFGIYCDNSNWYATNGPIGGVYTTKDGSIKEIGTGGEFNLKKTKINSFICKPPAPPQPQCTCPDFGELIDFDIDEGENETIIDNGECSRKLTCAHHYSTFLSFYFNETEISPPSDVHDDERLQIWLRSSTDLEGYYEPPGPPLDMFSYYGIICENNTWYATKAPLGFMYNTVEAIRTGGGSGGLLDGVKTKINSFGCKPPGPLPSCNCPDIREIVDPREAGTQNSIAIDTIPFTMSNGCTSSMTCGTHVWTWVRSAYNESEITFPNDFFDFGEYMNIDTVQSGMWNAPPGPSFDIFSHFGLICENNEWYVTKYPVGVEYFTGTEMKRIGTNGELNGKKSKVKKIFCTPPGPPQPQCTCPEVRDMIDTIEGEGETVTVIDNGGCSKKMMCAHHYLTYVTFHFPRTEISPPSDVHDDFDNAIWLRTSTNMGWYLQPLGPPVDLFSYFGIICENNTWYATKAPLGFMYNTFEARLKGGGSGVELNGLKTEIDSFSCKPPGPLPACSCSDIREIVDPIDSSTAVSTAIDTVPFTMTNGCVTSMTCLADPWTWLRSSLSDSEVTPPDDYVAVGPYLNIPSAEDGYGPRNPVEMFSYFGIICENNEWYATKYPVGIEYFTETEFKHFGTNGEMDGKKSKISQIFCMPPAPTSTLPPVATPPIFYCYQCQVEPILNNIESGQYPITDHITRMTQAGCIEAVLRCTNDNKICNSIQVYAKTATETIAIGNDDILIAEATLSCTQESKWASGTASGIESVFCVFEACEV